MYLLIFALLSCDTAPAPAPAPVEAKPAPVALPEAPKLELGPAPTPGPKGPAWPPGTPRPLDALVQQAADLVKAGKAAEAKAILDGRLATDPKDLDALVWRGRAHGAIKEVDLGVADVTAALAIDPSMVDARIAITDLLIPARRCPEALPHLEWMVTSYPDWAEVWSNRAFCRFATGDVEGGIADAEQACARGQVDSCERLPVQRARLKRRQELQAVPPVPAQDAPGGPPAEAGK